CGSRSTHANERRRNLRVQLHLNATDRMAVRQGGGKDSQRPGAREPDAQQPDAQQPDAQQPGAREPDAARESVVLVHGLWMPGWETFWLRRRLEAAGYSTFQFVYPTIDCGLDENAARLAEFAAALPGER